MSKTNNKSTNKSFGKDGKGSGNKGDKFRPRGDKTQGRQRDLLGTPYRDQHYMNRGNSNKQEREAAEAANTDAKLSRPNPVSFYTKFDRFVTDAATLPFATPVGAINTFTEIFDGKLTTSQECVPGVMRIEFIPAIGISKDFSSPINRSSIRFYTYLRSNQKASSTYDHQDITMMEIALDSCYMFHGLMSKIYAVINQFTPVNEYYSRAVVAACNANFEDIRAHMQDLRGYINSFAYSLGQYALPKDVTLFDRHRWMVEGMYTDSTSTKAQTYLFVPQGFWKYDNTVTTGSQCTFQPYSSQNAFTFEALKSFGDTLLNAVSNEGDFAVISGDIYNFYGGQTYTLPYIDENYSILPLYDETVLSQIENLTLPGLIDPDTLVISQNPEVNQGAIIFTPVVTDLNSSAAQVYMNFHHDKPTPDQVIEATRLISTTTVSNGKVIIDNCGTEIVQQWSIFGRNPSTGTIEVVASMHSNAGTFYDDYTTNEPVLVNELTNLAQFDWAPQVRVWKGTKVDDPSNVFTFYGSTWDIDNFDVVPKNFLSNIHLGCLLSLFKSGTNQES